MSAKLGILAYASKNGLSYQTAALYKYLKPDKVMLLDISQFNGQKVYEDWYNFGIRTNGVPTNRDIDKFLQGLDIVFVCETPLNYYLFERAEQLGIKTILQVNPEFCDYFNRPFLPKPTVFALPSLWLVNKFDPKIFPHLVHLPVPVDTDALPYRIITEAKTFFHIAGRPAVNDRNGTLDFIEAVKMVQYEINASYIVYAQNITPEMEQAAKGSHVLFMEAEDPADMYKEGDVLILPRKYGGLCLPAQEAVACGIPVIMTRIEPNTNWLPEEWLIPVGGKFSFTTRLEIDAYTVNRKALANFMIYLYHNPANVAVMGKQARDMGEQMGWDKAKIRYITLMEGLSVRQHNLPS